MKWVVLLFLTCLGLLLSTGCALNVEPGKISLCVTGAYAPEEKGHDGGIEITVAENVMDFAHAALALLLPAKESETVEAPAWTKKEEVEAGQPAAPD